MRSSPRFDFQMPFYNCYYPFVMNASKQFRYLMLLSEDANWYLKIEHFPTMELFD